jgi:hypothetical protein
MSRIASTQSRSLLRVLFLRDCHLPSDANRTIVLPSSTALTVVGGIHDGNLVDAAKRRNVPCRRVGAPQMLSYLVPRASRPPARVALIGVATAADAETAPIPSVSPTARAECPKAMGKNKRTVWSRAGMDLFTRTRLRGGWTGHVRPCASLRPHSDTGTQDRGPRARSQ